MNKNKLFQNTNIVTMGQSFELINKLTDSVFGGTKLTHDHSRFISVTSDRFKVLGKINSITPEMLSLAVVVPEGFKGNLNLYADDLNAALYFLQKNIGPLMNGVIVDVNKIINNASDMKSHPPTTIVRARQIAKELDGSIKKMNGWFEGSGSHSPISDILPNIKAVEELLIKSGTVSESLRLVEPDRVAKLYKELSDVLGVLEQVYQDPSVHSHEAGRTYNEILEETIVVGRIVEFFGYIHALTLQFLGTVESIVSQLKQELN